MRYMSLLAVLVLLLGVGLAPRGAYADDELEGTINGVAMPTPGDTALATLMTPLTKLTEKVFPDSSGVVAQVLPESGGPSTEYVIIGVQYGDGMASYSKLDAGLMDNWLALLDPSDMESSEMDAKAILEAKDALLLAYQGGGGDSLIADSQALIKTRVAQATA